MEDDQDIDAKRDRSPPFPYLGLAAALDLIRRLQQVAKSSEVRLAQVAPHWNTTATSGALARYVGAVQGYGLVESSGSGADRKIKITEAGRRILEDIRPGVAEQLLAEAALKPKLFAELFRVWGYSRPHDDIARSALQFDYNFTPVAAKRFLTVYDQAIGYVPMADSKLSNESDLPTHPPIENEARKFPETRSTQLINHFVAEAGSADSSRRRDVFGLDEGEVEVTMPKSLSRASFEDFSAWIDLVRRKVERSVKD